jgi:signal peptidase I
MNLQLILGNFALILFVAMVITGVIWCLDVFVFARQRRAAADAALAEYDARSAKLTADGIKVDNGTTARCWRPASCASRPGSSIRAAFSR